MAVGLVHIARVGISKISAILIALSMLFAPFLMQSGAAMAAVPSDQHQMTSDSHCDEPTDADQSDATPGNSCCAAMCNAVAVSGREAVVERPLTALPAVPHAIGHYRGILDEISTPPPRVA